MKKLLLGIVASLLLMIISAFATPEKAKAPSIPRGFRAETGCIPVNPAHHPAPIPSKQSGFV
jgi:hypothetical protein